MIDLTNGQFKWLYLSLVTLMELPIHFSCQYFEDYRSLPKSAVIPKFYLYRKFFNTLMFEIVCQQIYANLTFHFSRS